MARWDVFREMESLRREMEDMFRGYGVGRMFEPSLLTTFGYHTYPSVKMREDKDNFYVDALIPGIDPKGLDMSVLKNTLTISGERKGEEVKDVTWHRRERSAGHFLKTIDLPSEIDAEKVRADYANGILTITLPKAESEKPKRIAITTA